MRLISFLLLALFGGAAWAQVRIDFTTKPPTITRITCPYHGNLLVLSGGGIRGAYQVGSIWYLVNKLGCTFDHIYGTSTGAVTAAFLSQAQDLPELKQRVAELVENYKTTSTDDIIDSHFLGTIRVFLPYALGGVDGINTLEPLARRLHAQIDPKRMYNITVLSVSLQDGPIKISTGGDGKVNSYPFEPEDLREFVLGSASIPIAVEPKRVRMWLHGAIDGFEGDLLTFLAQGVGLPDPNCEVDFGEWRNRCERVQATKVRLRPGDPDTAVGWKHTVRLVGLSAENRNRLKAHISSAGEGWRSDVHISTIHQLVDGGVTEQTQIQNIDRTLGGTDSNHVIVLGTSVLRPKASSAQELRGGKAIGLASLDILWESYQQRSMLAALADARYRPLLGSARTFMELAVLWRQEFKVVLGEEELRKLESRMHARFPTPSEKLREALRERSLVSQRPELHIFTPDARIFTGTFDADLSSINAALYFGCAMVANYAKKKPQANDSEPDDLRELFMILTSRGNDECQPLLKPSKSHKPAFTDYFETLLTDISRENLRYEDLKLRAASGAIADKVRWCAVATTYAHKERGYHPEEGVSICRELAEKDDPMGLMLLGRVLEHGRGAPANPEEAARLYERAANQGLSYAMVDLGGMYKDGRGVRQDRQVARQWFQRAAEHGSPDAFNALGELLRSGGPEESKEAMSWLRRAAAEGHQKGVENLMRMVQEVPQE